MFPNLYYIEQAPLLEERENSIWAERFFQSLSFVFPAYNDEKTIGELVLSAQKIGRRHLSDFEIIVVNDGSIDGTRDFLNALLFEVPELKVIHHSRNMGYGAAIMRGLRESCKDAVFYTDGDGQYQVKELTLLIPHYYPGINLVNGYKKKRADKWYRILLGNLYRWSICTFFDLPIRDPDCDFRLIRRSILSQLEFNCVSGAFCVELVKKICRKGKNKIVEVPISHYQRMHGTSQFFCLQAISKTVRSLPPLWCKQVIEPKWLSAYVAFKDQFIPSSRVETVTSIFYCFCLHGI